MNRSQQSYCFLCTFPIGSNELSETLDATQQRYIHSTCLPPHSLYRILLKELSLELEASDSKEKHAEEQRHHQQESDYVHSAELYLRMCQLYFTVLGYATHLVLPQHDINANTETQTQQPQQTQQLLRRCNPLTGCNLIKPLHDFEIVEFKGNSGTEGKGVSLLLDASNFDRRCRSCLVNVRHTTLHRASTSKFKRQGNEGKRLVEFLRSVVVQKLFDRLSSIVQSVSEESVQTEQTKERIVQLCLEQWQRQQGACAHCRLSMSIGQKSIDIDWERTFVTGLCDVTVRYLPETHQIEWIHEVCSGFHLQQSYLFAMVLNQQYNFAFSFAFPFSSNKTESKDSNESKETINRPCACIFFRQSLISLVQRIGQCAAPFVSVLKKEPIWIQTWSLFREECGSTAFQDVATFILDLQQRGSGKK